MSGFLNICTGVFLSLLSQMEHHPTKQMDFHFLPPQLPFQKGKQYKLLKYSHSLALEHMVGLSITANQCYFIDFIKLYWHTLNMPPTVK